MDTAPSNLPVFYFFSKYTFFYWTLIYFNSTVQVHVGQGSSTEANAVSMNRRFVTIYGLYH